MLLSSQTHLLPPLPPATPRDKSVTHLQLCSSLSFLLTEPGLPTDTDDVYRTSLFVIKYTVVCWGHRWLYDGRHCVYSEQHWIWVLNKTLDFISSLSFKVKNDIYMVTLCLVCQKDAESFSKVTVTFTAQNVAMTQYVDLVQFLFLLKYLDLVYLLLNYYNGTRGKSNSSSPRNCKISVVIFPNHLPKNNAKLMRWWKFASDVFVFEKCLMLTRKPRACAMPVDAHGTWHIWQPPLSWGEVRRCTSGELTQEAPTRSWHLT